jgi:phosphoribosylformimino-5-aminoimidazole carboxamide ribotide isomerase
LVASGGISGIKDVYKMKDIGCSGTIIGKPFMKEK